jgi:hypothetical protein
LIRSFLPLGVRSKGRAGFDKVLSTFWCEVKGEAKVGAAGSILEPGQVGQCCGQLDKNIRCEPGHHPEKDNLW